MNDSNTSNCSDFEILSPIRSQSQLEFDVNSLEELILKVGDVFKFRLVLGNKNTRNAMCLGTGLAIAGSMIGRHYGGKLGAIIGGTVGGACAVGVVGKI